MKEKRILEALGNVDKKYIEEAAPESDAEKNARAKRIRLRWGAVAAGLTVLVITGAVALHALPGRNSPPEGDSERYKDYNVQVSEAIAWPWEYKTVYEKYRLTDIGDLPYSGTGGRVSDVQIDRSLGRFRFTGYDDVGGGTAYTEEFEVYTLKKVAQSQFVAAKMDGDYYVFRCDRYAPPATLGDLMKDIDLPAVTEIRRFSENNGFSDSQSFLLEEGSSVWDILSGCGEAPFVEDSAWSVGGRHYLSFTVTAETLGAYKQTMYITEDGYLWTNLFSWQYLFRIGEDAAGKLIRYTKEHAAPAEAEPYRPAVIGTVTKIAKDYLLVDDSVLCRDPADGVTYKVLLNDLRISRYVSCGVVQEGDTVQILYDGERNGGGGTTIENAISAMKVVLSGGGILIPD